MDIFFYILIIISDNGESSGVMIGVANTEFVYLFYNKICYINCCIEMYCLKFKKLETISNIFQSFALSIEMNIN